MAYVTDSAMVHDPVMAYENGTYYLLSTGMGLSWATSKDRKTWVIQSTPFIEKIPEWTYDSVPGFRGHVWAPDVVKWKGRWWLAYSCSTFGKNTSAITEFGRTKDVLWLRRRATTGTPSTPA